LDGGCGRGWFGKEKLVTAGFWPKPRVPRLRPPRRASLGMTITIGRGSRPPRLRAPGDVRAYIYHGGVPLQERQLIARIREMSGKKSLIGDDCAVLDLPARHEVLVTTDLCLEGVHFRRDWHPAESVGHRCLARGLSDIA